MNVRKILAVKVTTYAVHLHVICTELTSLFTVFTSVSMTIDLFNGMA